MRWVVQWWSLTWFACGYDSLPGELIKLVCCRPTRHINGSKYSTEALQHHQPLEILDIFHCTYNLLGIRWSQNISKKAPYKRCQREPSVVRWLWPDGDYLYMYWGCQNLPAQIAIDQYLQLTTGVPSWRRTTTDHTTSDAQCQSTEHRITSVQQQGQSCTPETVSNKQTWVEPDEENLSKRHWLSYSAWTCA